MAGTAGIQCGHLAVQKAQACSRPPRPHVSPHRGPGGVLGGVCSCLTPTLQTHMSSCLVGIWGWLVRILDLNTQNRIPDLPFGSTLLVPPSHQVINLSASLLVPGPGSQSTPRLSPSSGAVCPAVELSRVLFSPCPSHCSPDHVHPPDDSWPLSDLPPKPACIPSTLQPGASPENSVVRLLPSLKLLTDPEEVRKTPKAGVFESYFPCPAAPFVLGAPATSALNMHMLSPLSICSPCSSPVLRADVMASERPSLMPLN